MTRRATRSEHVQSTVQSGWANSLDVQSVQSDPEQDEGEAET